mmetsp:Transcript_72875/g.160895  ORF Transcript_72875/g.160895 Transcript_72875/m.160895 type:complete len:89 (-) Transcript_72875:126-392(-)
MPQQVDPSGQQSRTFAEAISGNFDNLGRRSCSLRTDCWHQPQASMPVKTEVPSPPSSMAALAPPTPQVPISADALCRTWSTTWRAFTK